MTIDNINSISPENFTSELERALNMNEAVGQDGLNRREFLKTAGAGFAAYALNDLVAPSELLARNANMEDIFLFSGQNFIFYFALQYAKQLSKGNTLILEVKGYHSGSNTPHKIQTPNGMIEVKGYHSGSNTPHKIIIK